MHGYCLIENRSFIAITGIGADNFLQGLITNDVRKITTEHPAIYAALLAPQGKFFADFFVIKIENGFLLDTHNHFASGVLKRLLMYRLKAPLEIKDVSTSYLAYAVFSEQSPALKDAIIFQDPRKVEMGFRAITSSVIKIPDLPELPLESYNLQRILNVIPEGFYDLISEQSFPLDYGFKEINGVDFKKGCYVGQEVTARMEYRGKLRKHVYLLEGNNFPKAGEDLLDNENHKVGIMGSSCGNYGLALFKDELPTNTNFNIKTMLTADRNE